VVAAGDNETGVPVKFPGVQTKVVPEISLEADKLDVPPTHILVGEAAAVMEGLGFTYMVTDAVTVQNVTGLEAVTV
jgi:hypothetical protein